MRTYPPCKAKRSLTVASILSKLFYFNLKRANPYKLKALLINSSSNSVEAPSVGNGQSSKIRGKGSLLNVFPSDEFNVKLN